VDATKRTVRVLMVCMGNICRSPTAEGVLRVLAEKRAAAAVATRARGSSGDDASPLQIEIDSAGTHGYHDGEPPDLRSQRHALARGYDLSAQRSRRVVAEDFARFDLLLAMDWDNHALLEERCPPQFRHKVKRIMQYAKRFDSPVVPDPYYGGDKGFEVVLDYLEDACDGLLDALHRN
jgi:protein-tyrosine phosphatase